MKQRLDDAVHEARVSMVLEPAVVRQMFSYSFVEQKQLGLEIVLILAV